MRQQTLLVLRNTIADLQRGVNLRFGAFEWTKVVKLRNRHRIAHPGEKLLRRNDPNWFEREETELTC